MLNLEEPRVDPKAPEKKAPPWYRTQEEIVRAALKDATGLPADIRRETHYLSLHNIPFAERAEFIRVLSYHINSLSRKVDITPPRVVSPDGSLLAVVDTDYGWNIVGKLGFFDSFWHEKVLVKDGKDKEKTQKVQARWLPQKEIAELVVLTNSPSPILNADWFFANTARQLSVFNGQDNKVGYTDFLGLKDRADFDKLIKFNKQDSIEIGADQRAALDRSGISIYGRQIEIFKALTGRRYGTLDNDDPTGRGNPINNLKPGEYQHKAEELIAVLPNGLPAWFLNNADGAKQATAPDFVGSNDAPLHQGRDFRIHVGPLSCGECHMAGENAVLRPIDDWVRRNISGPLALGAVAKKDFDELKRQYFSVLDTQLQADRLLFSTKILEVSGMKPGEMQKAYSGRFYKFALGEYGPEQIGALMGIDGDLLQEELRAYAKAHGFLPSPSISILLKEPAPGSMRIEHVEEQFSVLQTVAQEYRK